MSSENIDTRTRILKAAWNQLDSNDVSIVRMADIAKTAGISRQALYLHFPTRADLLIETTQYIDKVKGVNQRLEPSRNATSGVDRLEKYIEALGNYIPEIYRIANALYAVKETDEAAASAWNDRMQAVRHGCEAAVNALSKDGDLVQDYTKRQATDVLWTLLSIKNWQQLTMECGWSQKQYIKEMKAIARRLLVK